MEFIIPLTEQKVKPHQVTALHLIAAFALLAWGAIAVLLNHMEIALPPTADGQPQSLKPKVGIYVDIIGYASMGFSLLVIFAALFRNKWLRSTSVNKSIRIIELIALTGIAIHLAVIQFTILAVAFDILAATIVFSLFWENNKQQTLQVKVGDSGITPPFSARRRNIAWSEIESTLLRHGTLTINCLDNRLYQWTTANHDIDQQAFENYCLAQIEAAKKDRRKDNW